MVRRLSEASFHKLYHTGTATPNADLLVRIYELNEAGCEDPLVQYMIALVYKDLRRTAESIEVLKHVVPRILESDYPPLRKCMAVFRLRSEAQDLSKKEVSSLQSALADSFVAAVLAADASPIERRIKYRALVPVLEKTPEAEREAILNRLRASKACDAWLLAMIEGYHQVQSAWEDRGEDWAYQVTKEGWKGFEQHLELARDACLEAYRLEPGYPEGPATMMSIVGAASDLHEDDLRTWFDRAIEAQFDYQEAWLAYGGNWLTLRWGGSVGEMYQVGLEALHSMRFDTSVPLVYLECLLKIGDELDGDFQFIANEVEWENIDALYYGYRQANSPGYSLETLQNYRCILAFIARKYETMLELRAEIGDRLDNAPFKLLGLEQNDVIALASAFVQGGMGADEAYQAEMRADYPVAIELYQDSIASLKPDSPHRSILDRHLRTCQLLRDFHLGSPVDLLRQDNEDLWRYTHKGSEFSDSGITCTFGEGGRAVDLTSRVRFKPGFKIHMEWRIVPGESEGNMRFGLDFHQNCHNEKVSFSMNPRGRLVQFGTEQYFYEKQKLATPSLLRSNTWHTVEVSTLDDLATVKLDREFVFDSFQHWSFDSGTPLLGLFAIAGGPGTKVEVRSLTIQRIDSMKQAKRKR